MIGPKGTPNKYTIKKNVSQKELNIKDYYKGDIK